MGDQVFYHQIGGFRPNVTLQGGSQYDMRKLAETIFGLKPPAELILGIRSSGASAILVAISEWTKIEAFNCRGTPQLASDFLSLSPLQFDDVSQLAKKLIALKPKGKRRGEDDSSANKAFLGSLTQAGEFRSAFEHSRLLFYALEHPLDVWRFSLSRSSSWVSAQVASLVFNEWTHQKGVILDVGWCLMDCSIHPPTFPTSVHLEVEDARSFGNRGKQRVAFRYGQTEVLTQNKISTRIRDLFRREQPLVLLVHNEGAVRALLKDLGINTLELTSGLKRLLQPDIRSAYRGQNTDRDSRRRSLSPRRDGPSREQRPRSPPRTQLPVYLVDVRQMYITLRTRVAESNASLAAIAMELGLPGDDKSMCAGNESRLLAEMWMSMAGDSAIDEQCEARWGATAVPVSSAAAQTASGSRSAPARTADPSDVDFDPNDLAPTGWTTAAQPSRPSQMMDWDELDDEEEEFYGR